MKKVYTLLAATLLAGATAFAVPAKKEFKAFKQIDGSEITLSLTGDEFLHYYVTTDGAPVLKAQDGSFRYVKSFNAGQAELSEVVARNPEERTSSDRIFVSQLMESQVFTQAGEARAQRINQKNSGLQKAAAFPSSGTVTGLLLLVEFQDLEFSTSNAHEVFDARLNTVNFQDDQCYGSVHDYFNAQSNGQFNMQFDVFGPVKVKGNMAEYGGNTAMGSDRDVPRMIKEACEALDSEIDFTKYDTDGDGLLDLVFAVYAGHGEAQGAPANTIWPHKYDVRTSYNVVLDGIQIGPYACSCELSGASGSQIDGIGTICHEFSHCLGLADAYDTDGSAGGSGWGLGDYCLMDSGSYNDDSFTPCGYTAFEKMSVGWLEPTELRYTIFGAELNDLETSNEAYIIYSDVNKDEFYMLENRQQSGWDRFIPYHGLLISHIDYNEGVWNSNSPNNILGKERFHIVPADNKSSYYTQANDLYPGRIKNTEFTDSSTPAAELRTGGFLGKPITNIAETNKVITFDFMADRIAAPVALDPTNVTTTSFTANWENVASTDHYTLKVTPLASTDPTGEILKESFSKFTEGSPESPSNTDISSKLDENMETQGWSGSKLYHAGGMCRIGLSLTKGYLATPDLDLPSKFVVTFSAKDYVTAAGKADGSILYIGHCSYDENGVTQFLRKETIELTGDERTYSFTFENGGAKQFIEFGNESKRVLIDNIRIANVGSTTAEEKVFENVTGSSFEVTGLVPNYVYSYTLVAYRGDLVSAESNAIEVETKLGISETVENNAAVRTNEYGVEILNAAEMNVAIFTIDGKLVKSFVPANNSEYVELANGLYIIRVNDKAFKVIF